MDESRLQEIDWENAQRNENRDLFVLEHKCRVVARSLGENEELWQDYKDIVYAVEAGRLESIRKYVKTPEEIESWRQYMASR